MIVSNAFLLFLILSIGLFVMLAIAYLAIERWARWDQRRKKRRHGRDV